jgi:hypothetical protein
MCQYRPNMLTLRATVRSMVGGENPAPLHRNHMLSIGKKSYACMADEASGHAVAS